MNEPLKEVAEASGRLSELLEAGRVLSAKSEAHIRKAKEELDACLAQIEREQKGMADDVLADSGYQESAIAEPLTGELVSLQESARNDGTVLLKLISPGWGTKGYYSAEVLKRDGPQVFRRGTQNYVNHMTEAEADARPEGDVRNLASVLTEDARYLEDGPRGPGLYARAKVFSDHAALIHEKGPHIGVSINAFGGFREGEAEGRKGRIVERIASHPLTTADYVTKAGRGGEVILQESAKTAGVPADAEGSEPPSEPLKEVLTMSDIDPREFEALKESVGNLKARLNENDSKIAELTAENNQLRQLQQLREAKDFALVKLKAIEGLPELLHERIADSVAGKPPIKNGTVATDLLEPLVEAAARKEMALLAKLGLAGGKVQGLGGGPADVDEDPAKLKESIQRRFQSIGLSETAAAHATAGRGRKGAA